MQDLLRIRIDWSEPELIVGSTWSLLALLAGVVVALLAVRWYLTRQAFRRSRPTLRLDGIDVILRLPGGEIRGRWEPDESERKAAWELYIELVTRTAVVELRSDEGSVREALSSLHSLFETTRKLLRQYGPSVARPKRSGYLSFGFLAVAMLNRVLRPVLAKWHPLLSAREQKRPADITPIEHERTWDRDSELREELARVRTVLTDYARYLEAVADVPSLITSLHEPKASAQ